MGLLDKAVKLATTAKDQYEELRSARDEAAVRPVAVPPLSDHSANVLRRALALGAPDPAALLSRAEASHVAGVELGEGSLTYDDSTIGVEYAASGRRNERWSVSVNVWYGDEDGFDALESYRFITEHVENDRMTDLGQEATWDGERLFVLAAPLLFHVEVRMPGGDGNRAEAVAVARRVLARTEG